MVETIPSDFNEPFWCYCLRADDGQEFKVNGQRLKYYLIERLVFEENIQLME